MITVCGSNILSNEEWGVFYVKVPAFKPNPDWEVIETIGAKKVKFSGGYYYIPKNGTACIKIRKKIDRVVFKEGRYYVKVGEDYTYRVIMIGDFGVRALNADEEIDGIEDPSPENLQNPSVPGEIKWVVIENAYGDPDYVNVITEDFVIDIDDKKLVIGPNGLGVF